jgi:hypothetical protein
MKAPAEPDVNEGGKRMKRQLLNISCAATIALAAATAGAQAPVIDGTADAAYGLAKSIQNTNTQFGDNNLGDLIATRNGGSEIDQVFAVVSGGRLHVTVTGNLERNFNKLEIYLDTKAGGVNMIDAANLPAGVDPFSGGALENQHGLTFDAGFDADYYLTFTHGVENHGGNGFWAMSAHYADLTNGTAGRVVSAGMQLGPQGLPVVLRFPFNSDFDNDADADGANFLTWQRQLGNAAATRTTGDANGDMVVDAADLVQWQDEFGMTRQFSDIPFAPGFNTPPTTALIGPTLPNLSQGQLIDKNYVAANGLVAPKLEFATEAFRNMENTIDLRMALNNSNTAGVTGEGPYEIPTDDPTRTTPGNPQNVITGIEFSIPLSEIGSPAGPIKMFAFINGTGHDFASNQFSGAGVLQGYLGGDGSGVFTGDLAGVNMSVIPGDQFVTVPLAATAAAAAIPEPNALLLAGHAVAAWLSARRRR